MPILSPRLRRLDGALASLAEEHGQAMLLSTLDGYLAGIVLCPVVIPLDEWLPEVWAGAQGAAAFADERDAAWFAALVSDHAAAILRALDRKGGRYQPFIEVDVAKGETLWELWIEGFAAAVDLRPDAWTSLTDERAAEAFAGIQTLIAIAFDESDLDRVQIDNLTDQAPALIPGYLQSLQEAHRVPNMPSTELTTAPPGKIGRNDACPCGSGKKYKKCCAAG
jgi:uncharacterized protein